MNDMSLSQAASAALEFAIDARGLVKAFGDLRAVDGVDLSVPRGVIFAILGPNGAGKTTLMRMLATLARPDSGTATVMGHDLLASPAKVRGSIAMTGQFASLDEDLTGRENLILLARLWGFRGRAAKARADELLAAFGLSDASAKQVKNYSGGMRRRLDIAASLVVTPGVLFLDEPTTGLDPRSRAHVWQVVRALVASGTTVLLTTQYLEEADQLAERIAVVDHGRVIADVEVEDLATVFVDARILVEVPVGQRNALLVPEGAVRIRSGIDFVTVAAGGGSIERAVVVGEEVEGQGGTFVEVISGLAAGDVVIIP